MSVSSLEHILRCKLYVRLNAKKNHFQRLYFFLYCITNCSVMRKCSYQQKACCKNMIHHVNHILVQAHFVIVSVWSSLQKKKILLKKKNKFLSWSHELVLLRRIFSVSLLHGKIIFCGIISSKVLHFSPNLQGIQYNISMIGLHAQKIILNLKHCLSYISSTHHYSI